MVLLQYSNNDKLVTADPILASCFEDVKDIFAPSGSNILIQGETGTGKEGIARAIHFYSDRKTGPFVAVNCATIPESLAESALFGHKKGSFTGAGNNQQGYFEQANKGTIFLDEISSLSHDNQARLLRVLQEGEVRQVGATKHTKVNVRVVAAGNIDIWNLVEKGKFRNDLYFRIAAAPITLSPLRKRHGDIELLTKHFLERFQDEFKSKDMTIAPDAMQILNNYGWPGNVRELENAIRYAVMMANGRKQKEINPSHLPQFLQKSAYLHTVTTPPIQSLESESSEKKSTCQTLLYLLGLRSPRKIAELAVEVKKDRSTVYRHIKRMAINGQVKIETERGREGSIITLVKKQSH